MKHWKNCPLFSKDKVDIPWMVLGKGPTFANYVPSDFGGYTYGLNDVVKYTKLDIAHFIDVDALDRVLRYVPMNAEYLILKKRMHMPNRGRMEAEQVVADRDTLKELDSQGKVFFYTRSVRRTKGDIYLRNFSAEVAFQMLGKAGVKTIHTYGIDSNKGYSNHFKNTLKTHHKKGYNAQENEIKHTCRIFGINWIRR